MSRPVVITPRKLSESQLRLARSRAAVDMQRERAADLTHSMGEPGVDALRRLAQPESYAKRFMSRAEWTLLCQFAQLGMGDAWLLYNERCEFHGGPEQFELRRMVEGPPADPSPASIVTPEEQAALAAPIEPAAPTVPAKARLTRCREAACVLAAAVPVVAVVIVFACLWVVFQLFARIAYTLDGRKKVQP